MQAFWAGLAAGTSSLLINQRSWDLSMLQPVVSSVRSKIMYLLINSVLPSDFYIGDPCCNCPYAGFDVRSVASPADYKYRKGNDRDPTVLFLF